jgi:hypothetical protein
VRQLVLARRAGVLIAAAACGALAATPALADVSVSPTSAVQGEGENFTFHVTNTGAQPVGTVTLKIPADTPVAEVYPLSVDNWAPKITMKTLASPLATIHGGTPTTQVTDTISWIAMPGHALAPGAATDLSIAIGPMPTLSTMRFDLSTLFSDGKPGPAMTPAAVALTVATAQQQAQSSAEHAGHEATGTDTTGTDDAQTQAENAEFAKAIADATRGPSIVSIGGWVLFGALLLGGGAWLMLRNRHRAEEDDEPEDEDGAASAVAAGKSDSACKKWAKPADEADDADGEAEDAGDKEPVTAGKWSLKG